MQRAIVRAYEKLIPDGCMPSYFIYITVDADRVDVNVHPQKTTVKFADHDLILEILQAAVRETLAKTGAVPLMDFTMEGQVNIPVLGQEQRIYHEPRASINSSYNPFASEYIDPTAPLPDVPFTGFDVPYDGAMPKPSQPKPSVVYEFGEEYDTVPSQSSIEYIGDDASASDECFDFVTSQSNVHRTFEESMPLPGGFAVAIYGGKGVVVHLRRAKERILYEEILKSMTAGGAPTQRMFFAEELTLSMEEYSLMEEHATEFAALGFEIEYRGEGHISVLGRPATLDIATPLDELIYGLVHSIDEGDMPLEEEQSRLAEQMARRGAQGYGRGLQRSDVEALLGRLERCDNPSFSPLGAPVMAEICFEELCKKLK